MSTSGQDQQPSAADPATRHPSRKRRGAMGIFYLTPPIYIQPLLSYFKFSLLKAFYSSGDILSIF
jgi:hypothetical protein